MDTTQLALDAITLVPRERVCEYNRDPSYADRRKLVDVDVYVAGQQRGTWRHLGDNNSYRLHLELLDGTGAMTYAESMHVDAASETLKATTADLLVAGKLPTRRRYFECQVMVLLVDNKLKIAAVLAIGLGYWLLR